MDIYFKSFLLRSFCFGSFNSGLAKILQLHNSIPSYITFTTFDSVHWETKVKLSAITRTGIPRILKQYSQFVVRVPAIKRTNGKRYDQHKQSNLTRKAAQCPIRRRRAEKQGTAQEMITWKCRWKLGCKSRAERSWNVLRPSDDFPRFSRLLSDIWTLYARSGLINDAH